MTTTETIRPSKWGFIRDSMRSDDDSFYAVLVYQAGIANVFAVDCLNMAPSGRAERRLMQGDFRTCEAYARGLADAGIKVASAQCNEAGDIARSHWDSNPDNAPFADNQRPIFAGVVDPRVV